MFKFLRLQTLWEKVLQMDPTYRRTQIRRFIEKLIEFYLKHLVSGVGKYRGPQQSRECRAPIIE